VICGLDGNDRINGRGGNDVIDAGAGTDVVDGDVGNDRIDGGGGTDSLYGQGGADLLRGGSGLDSLQGGADSDGLYGDAGSDTASGGTGNDVLTGGDGNDRLAGDSGTDKVDGDAGDDDLSGGAGGDDVDGGAGFNVCDQPGAANDQQIRCVVDESKPVVEDVATIPSTVDVSAAAQSVRIEAHVIDDTGVKSVQIHNIARLVSGTSRDGVWATTIQVPRYITPGPRDVDVYVRDRVGRSTSATLTNAYTVLNTVSDQEMPVLQSMSLSTTAVDVRSASKPITATIHVTDDLAGATDLVLCPAHAFPSGTPKFRQAGACDSMEKTSGTPTDSTWKATYIVPKGAPSGTWNFQVWISDATGNAPNDFWFGPDELAAIEPTNEPRYRAIPDGGGTFAVQGTAQDLNAPALTSLNLNPSTVDTSTGAVQITADIAGTDIEGITGAGLFIHGYAGYPDNATWTDTVDVAWVQSFQLVRGTPQDGVWHATFVVPGGTPDGSYFIQVALQDSSHFESWVSPDSGWTTDSHLLTLELAPTGNHLVVVNS
jgi:Ca2+-binding RTX toxin-like protein